MKTFLIAAILCFSTAALHAQNLDKGFGKLKIDGKIAGIKTYLVATPKEQFLDKAHAEAIGDYLLSGYTFDFKKAGMTTYFGAEITRIEVFFDMAYDETGEKELGEQVSSFIVYTEKVTDPADLGMKLVDHYGDVIPYMDEETGEPITLTFFSNVTLLSVIFGTDQETGESLGYYMADYSRSSGG